jgi:Tol biopolymer transport system component
LAIDTGTRFDHYEIIAPLGAGGMGEVYLARDTKLERTVALKFLPADVAADRQRMIRFTQEARTASALNHPNIITIYEIGASEATHFIATEFVDGATLRERMRRAPMSTEEALDVAAQVAAALAAAHEAGVIHRDIKPENIMLRRDRLVKVLDFGLAKLIEREDAAPPDAEARTRHLALTTPGAVMGTIDYMSPEQARGIALDERTDIWSLGVVLYEMIAGRRPFAGGTTNDVIAAILKTEAPPLTSVADAVPGELRRIAQKALRPRREERYQTVKDLLIDLKSLRRELEFSAHSQRQTGAAAMTSRADVSAPARSSILAAPRFSLRHLLFALPVALLLLVGATWWLWARRGAPTETFAPASLKTAELISWSSAPGEGDSPAAFSPDGKRIAFSSTQSGTKNIWIKNVASGEAVQVTKDDFVKEYPIWSPDGEEIAFFSTRGGTSGLWRIPELGGQPSLITTLQDAASRPKLWSSRGVIYYESHQNLFSFDLKSGQATQITHLDPDTTDPDSLSISPDETRVAYIKRAADGTSNLWHVPAGGGAAEQLTHDSSEHIRSVWAHDGKRVLYSANVEGTFQIFAAPLDGRPPAQLTFGDRGSFVMDVSADGARVLFASSVEELDVWGVDVAHAAEFAFTKEISAEMWPAVAPDGKTVAYQAIRNLSQGDKIDSGAIMIKATGVDAQPAQLVANGFLPTWSPDGSQLAFLRRSGDTYNLLAIKATGGAERQLTAGGIPPLNFNLLPYSRVQVSEFSWSPSGGEIAYVSDRSGQNNLWIVSADGSRDVQVTNNGEQDQFLHCPLWSPDGQRIAFTAEKNARADGKRGYNISVIEPETKVARLVFQSDTAPRLLGWSPDGKRLFVANLERKIGGGSRLGDARVRQVSVETGEQRTSADLQSVYLNNIHLSADGKLLAFTAHQDGKDNLWVVPVGGGAARRLTANNDPRLYFSSLAWSPDGRAIYFGKQSRHSLLSMIVNYK